MNMRINNKENKERNKERKKERREEGKIIKVKAINGNKKQLMKRVK